MRLSTLPSSRRGKDPAVWLIGLLLVVNLLAVLGMVRAREEARLALDEGLLLEVHADARALEAALAREHAHLEEFAASLSSSGPIGGTLAEELDAHPAIVRLRMRDEDGSIRAVARRDPSGEAVLVQPDELLPLDTSMLRAARPLADGGTLEVWVDPEALLREIDPALLLHRSLPAAIAGPLEKVTSPTWTPALGGWIERRESTARVLGVVESLARRYRLTLLFNVILLPVLLLLGALTLRRVRRLARLEGEREQQERMRLLEQQVQHAERLASIGSFAAGTAHEINNPLEGMANYLSLLREDLASGRLEEAEIWVDRLGAGIEQVAGTVRRVLDFAEPGARPGAREHEPVVPAELLAKTLSLLRGHPDCRSATIRLDCPIDLVIDGNPVTFGQLAFNLVLNACQAQGGKGEVEVLVRAVAIEEEDFLELRVLDRGPGFAPEVVAHLFEPFQSTRGSSGLGLAVCHGIVHEHRGTIEVRSRTGGGSEVLVRMPMQLAVEESL